MKYLNKILAVALAATMIGFTGCAGNDDEKETTKGTTNTSEVTQAEDTDSKEMKVGIIQYLTHASLDNCTQGIINAIDGKVEYDVQIGSAGSADTDCESFAGNMVAKDYDAIIAVATPAAMKAYSAVINASADIPVIFCAVSDPIQAGLVESLENPGVNCTGTCDAFDIEGQVKLIKTLQPDIKKLGVIYTTNEANSISQLKTLKEVAEENGIEIVDQGINEVSEIASASVSIVSKVDAITNLTDNNVVDNMSVLLQQAKEANIPVYGSEIEQVKLGCLASASLDYVALGEKTGNMALEILDGKSAAETPVITVVDSFEVLNEDVLSQLGLTLPDELKDIEKVNLSE